MVNNIEPTLEKSQEIAELINMMKPMLLLIDVDYVKMGASEAHKQASWQDSLSVLNHSYDFTQGKLLHAQGYALESLAAFIDALKECDELRTQIGQNKRQQEQIKGLFI